MEKRGGREKRKEERLKEWRERERENKGCGVFFVFFFKECASCNSSPSKVHYLSHKMLEESCSILDVKIWKFKPLLIPCILELRIMCSECMWAQSLFSLKTINKVAEQLTADSVISFYFLLSTIRHRNQLYFNWVLNLDCFLMLRSILPLEKCCSGIWWLVDKEKEKSSILRRNPPVQIL